jgi:hypothetical protein
VDGGLLKRVRSTGLEPGRKRDMMHPRRLPSSPKPRLVREVIQGQPTYADPIEVLTTDERRECDGRYDAKATGKDC